MLSSLFKGCPLSLILYPLSMATAYLALGSNLGDRAAILAAAVEILGSLPRSRLLAVSSFHHTAPVDAPAGSPPFLNAAAALQTDLPAQTLLHRLLDIEVQLGRSRADTRNAPRTLDLDLLLYDHLVISEGDLTVPHPRMTQRRFVLAPLAEIAPQAYHPVAGRTVAELLAALPAEAGAT